MQISPDGIAFIESNEGFRAAVYDDNGKQAIGYGHDLEPGESYPNGITQPQARQLLLGDLSLVELTLAKNVPPTCTQNQWDALCDFGYNDGVAALKLMLSHGWSEVPQQMLRWEYEDENGVETIDPALEARRQREVSLFNS
jgi:GH24 family phage-related lysozyme (muramidase)